MFTIGIKLQNLIPFLFITTSRISYFVCLMFNNFVAYKHQYHNRPVKDRYWFKKKKTTYKDHCNKSTIQEESSWLYVVQSHHVVTRLAFVQWQNKYAKCQFTWLTICPMYRLRQKFLPQKCLRLHDKQCTHYYSTHWKPCIYIWNKSKFSSSMKNNIEITCSLVGINLI